MGKQHEQRGEEEEEPARWLILQACQHISEDENKSRVRVVRWAVKNLLFLFLLPGKGSKLQQQLHGFDVPRQPWWKVMILWVKMRFMDAFIAKYVPVRLRVTVAVNLAGRVAICEEMPTKQWQLHGRDLVRVILAVYSFLFNLANAL